MVGPWAIKNSGGVTDVEPVDPSTLQFSTSVEVRLGIVGSSVRYQFSRRTAHGISAKLGRNLQHNKVKKRTRPFVWEKSGSFNNHERVPKIAIFQL